MNKFFDTFQTYLLALDKKTWYRYLMVIAAVFFLIVGIILFFYYSKTARWQTHIIEINEQRQEAKNLLNKAIQVQKDRAQVTALLEEEPNFKIKEYMQEVFERVGISIIDNVSSDRITIASGNTVGNYREDTIKYQLTGITMRQLTHLLEEIEKNKRVFTKELDIIKSKKVPRTIDVDIRISTMMPKETP